MVAQVYLMTKYRWNASKTLEYLAAKKPDLVITTEILAAFQMLERELKSKPMVSKISAN